MSELPFISEPGQIADQAPDGAGFRGEVKRLETAPSTSQNPASRPTHWSISTHVSP